MSSVRSRLARWARPLPILRRYPVTYVRSWFDGRRLGADFERVRAYVMFVGQPRTGHSLVGALLDAHPRALIAHELDALKYVEAGYDRRRLFALAVRTQQRRVAAGHQQRIGYKYLVEGQPQGRYERLEVIGDKKGGQSTLRLGRDIGLLDRLQRTVGVDVFIVQVVRNPFDVIATMHRREPRRSLPDVVDRFFDQADTSAEVRRRVGEAHFHQLRHEDVVADPRRVLADLCSFVGLDAPAAYLDACASIVFDAPRRTRDDVPWTADLLAEVSQRAAARPDLAAYRFEAA